MPEKTKRKQGRKPNKTSEDITLLHLLVPYGVLSQAGNNENILRTKLMYIRSSGRENSSLPIRYVRGETFA